MKDIILSLPVISLNPKNISDSEICTSGDYCSVCMNRSGGNSWRDAVKIKYPETKIELFGKIKCIRGLKWGAENQYPLILVNLPKEFFVKTWVKKSYRIGKKLILSSYIAIKSVVKTYILRKDRTPEEWFNERLNTCRNCPSSLAVWKNGDVWTCGNILLSMLDQQDSCGCVLRGKARDAHQECPNGHWKSVDKIFKKK